MLRILLSIALISGSALAADPIGVPNFHQVDDHVYRGAQPTAAGFQNLAKLGIKTVIDLREPGSRERAEEKTVVANGMRYIPMPLNGYHAPSNDQITQFLATVNREPGPVFIHCRRGADRTGTVVACYRIACQNWTQEKALAEAKQYGMSWTEWSMQNFVRHFTAVPAQVIATPATTP